MVDIDIANNVIVKEERRKRADGPWGMSAEEVRQYVRSAVSEGMYQIEEIQIDNSGYVEVEGHNASGREMEIDFRAGNFQPIKISYDD